MGEEESSFLVTRPSKRGSWKVVAKSKKVSDRGRFWL
jgi:hypothetical protein